MRRLFWTFPDGLPGAGLLLLRLTICGTLLARYLSNCRIGPFLPLSLCVVEGASAVLLLAGLATPIAAAAGAVVELWRAYSDPSDVFVHLMLAALGTSLALLGPGAVSVDARLFGWRRIDVRPARSGEGSDHTMRQLASKDSSDDSN